MSIMIEHDKRRNSILEKALDVFMDEGFEYTTFQKIADKCRITRTTLYLYFNNKKEIFTYSIKLMLIKMEERVQSIQNNESLSCTDKITRVLLDIIRQLQKNQKLLIVILDYLFHLSRSDADADIRVRRRTIKLRHFLSTMLIQGVKTKELAPINIKVTNDYLYSFIEAAIFRLGILRRPTVEELEETVIQGVKQLKNNISERNHVGNKWIKKIFRQKNNSK